MKRRVYESSSVNQIPTCCPNCGANIKNKSKLRNQFQGDTYMGPTTYECGTIISENWSPPIYGKECK